MIRLAKESDLSELAQVYTRAYNAEDIGEKWSEETALKLVTYLYEDQPDLFFVVEEDGRIVGAIVATVRPWWDGNHLIEGEIFLHPDFQHKGFGKELVKKLFSTAKEKYQVVAWDTYTHIVRENPLAWYKKIGFKQIEHWTMITGNVDEVLKNLEK